MSRRLVCVVLAVVLLLVVSPVAYADAIMSILHCQISGKQEFKEGLGTMLYYR